MSIILKEILKVRGDRVLATIIHEENLLKAQLYGTMIALQEYIDKELFVEISFDSIDLIKIEPDFNDINSGIFESPEGVGEHVVRGRVHNILQPPNKSAIVDIYLQNGPEYLAINSRNFDHLPEIGDGVSLTVSGLCFYPTAL